MSFHSLNIGIASDHAGYELKEYLTEFIKSSYPEVELIDFGTKSETESVDYPDFAQKLCKDLLKKKIGATIDRGILICGTGIGMSIAANRYKGIRAALCHDVIGARLTRQHNDSNVLCLGSWFVTKKMSEQIMQTWMETTFEGVRHKKRIDLLEI